MTRGGGTGAGGMEGGRKDWTDLEGIHNEVSCNVMSAFASKPLEGVSFEPVGIQ